MMITRETIDTLSRGLGSTWLPRALFRPPQGHENSITLDLRTVHLLVLCRSSTKQLLTTILVLSRIKDLGEWSRKQVRKEEVVKVEKCSYNSLMHVQRKASVRYAYCQKGMKRKTPCAMQVSSPCPSHWFRTIPSRSQNPTRVIVNKLQRKQKHPENRKTKRL